MNLRISEDSERDLEPGQALACLERQASRFELGALIKLLFSCGFGWESIRFEGVRTLFPEGSPFVRQLKVHRTPTHEAVVSLNAGLLGSVSPLPAYFREFAQRLANPDDFISFLGFWDAVHLKNRAVGLLPELGPNRRALASAHLARMRTETTPFLHNAFRGVFPELEVSVTHETFYHVRDGARARVGAALDGRIILGAQFGEHQSGFAVGLYAEAEASQGVSDWEAEAQARLVYLEDFLSRQRVPTEVALVFANYRHGQSLVESADSRRQLGVRPWLLKERNRLDGAARVILREAFS